MASCKTDAMHGCSSVIFCIKPVPAAKEMADGSLTKNRRGYKNNLLAAAYRPNRRFMAAYGVG